MSSAVAGCPNPLGRLFFLCRRFAITSRLTAPVLGLACHAYAWMLRTRPSRSILQLWMPLW
jgi:hypothetical protein